MLVCIRCPFLCFLLLSKLQNYKEASRLFNAVWICQKRRKGSVHADSASALHNVGIAELRGQNFAAASAKFEDASFVRKQVLGRHHPQVAVRIKVSSPTANFIFTFLTCVFLIHTVSFKNEMINAGFTG